MTRAALIIITLVAAWRRTWARAAGIAEAHCLDDCADLAWIGGAR